jgi:hypothetical protein
MQLSAFLFPPYGTSLEDKPLWRSSEVDDDEKESEE